jgi:hypothetical protein
MVSRQRLLARLAPDDQLGDHRASAVESHLRALSVKRCAATPQNAWRGEFATNHGPSKEVVAASSLAERVNVDVAGFVAWEDQCSITADEGLEPDLEVQGLGD